MATSEQLENEADATRGRIEDTLGELRRRLSPGLLMDDVLGFAKESGGGEFVRNLGRDVSANPLPLALMGAGLAWLMASQAWRPTSSTGTRRPGFKEWAERTEAMSDYDTNKTLSGRPDGAGKSDSYYDKASDMAGSARDRASEMYDRARETTSDMYDRARDTTAGAYDKARDAAGTVTRSMSSALDSTRGVANFMQEQPIVLAGIGVAIWPRFFAYVVAAWLLGIVINLLLVPGFYDIALRDFGLYLAAIALGRLSQEFSAIHRSAD